MGFGHSYGARIGRGLLRAAGAVLPCLLAGAAHGQASGMAALSNGAIVEWRIEEGGDGPALGLAVPAFARWTKSAFDAPVTVEMRSEGHAVADAWQLSFHRAGDALFTRPLRRFRGDAATLGDPVAWDGRVAHGPPLRPGETVVVRFEIRDVAGNIDRAAPQDMLIARYAMPAERRSIAATVATRARSLAEGEPPVPRGIPVRGAMLVLTVTDWLDSEGPRASGVRFRRQGRTWILRQSLTPGPHEVVIQSTRAVMGGVRKIPVGIVAVDAPEARPLHARVKGTGRLDKASLTATSLSSEDFLPEAMVPGRIAISRPMTHRDGGEDRLALALIDADAPVTLAMDWHKRMALLSVPGAGAGVWPREGATRLPSEPGRRRVSATLAVPEGGGVTLAHTDIVPGSLRLTTGAGASLEPGRDYAASESEGRVLLLPSALARLAEEPGATTVRASYAVPVFGDEAVAPAGGADDTWARAEAARRAAGRDGDGEGGLLARLLRLFSGGG